MQDAVFAEAHHAAQNSGAGQSRFPDRGRIETMDAQGPLREAPIVHGARA